MEQIFKLSAKMLGEIAMADFCQRCFWLRLKTQNRLPFQKFAGISMVLDSYTKRIVSEHYERYHRIPNWFKPFGDLEMPVPVPHHSKFFIIDEETNIRLTGIPDAIFKCRDDSYCIIDYKTARWSENQEMILPMYQVQLNGYAWIAVQVGFHPVSKVGLLYFEAQTIAEQADNFDSLVMNDGFNVQFCARYVDVELNPQKIIPPLLKKAREMMNLKAPPASRDGCKDCQLMERLIGEFGGTNNGSKR